MPQQHDRMSMSFYWSNDFTLLFAGWIPNTPFLYFLSLTAAFLLAILHEWFAHARSSANSRFDPADKGYNPSSSSENSSPITSPKLLQLIFHELLIYGGYITTGYLLMMMIMSFNAGIFLTILVGLCFGFAIFRFKLQK